MKQVKDEGRKRRSSLAVELAVSGALCQSGEYWINVVQSENSAWIQRSEFSGAGASAIRQLATIGVHVIGAQRVRALVEQVAAIRDFPMRSFAEHCGWNIPHFVLPDASVFSPGGSPSPEVLFRSDPTKCAVSGTLEGWQRCVATPLARHPIPAFFIMAAFAAPILTLLARYENFGFELVGVGGIGKSTVQRLMASVLGPPRSAPFGYPIAMDATRVGLAAEMRRHADLPLILDDAISFAPGESSRSRGVKLRELGMKLGLGHETRKDGRPDPASYRFVFVISANEGMRELTVGESRAQNEAASDRLIPFYLVDRQLGVFHRKPTGYKGTRAFARALEQASLEHHGTAIREFLRRLVQGRHDDPEGLRAALERRIQEFCEWAGVDRNDGSEWRVAEAFAIVMTAGRLACRYGVLPPSFNCQRTARRCYRLHLGSSHPGSSKDPACAFLDELRQLARSSEVIRLEGKQLTDLTTAHLDEFGVFLRTGGRQSDELQFWGPYFRRRYPDFGRLLRLPAIAAAMDRDDDHATRKRVVRAGYPKDRFYCFPLAKLMR